MGRLRKLAAAFAAVLVALMSSGADAAGLLVPRGGGGVIRVRSQRVTAVVEDGIARTTVRQTFVSEADRALEAVYTFPVPQGAALVDVAMETGGQRYEGLLAERKTARRTYDRLVQRNIDPALVEQIGRETFRLSVFPVLPQKETVVELTWTETCPVVRDEVRYVYPLALAGEATSTEKDFTFSLTIRSSAVLGACTSDTPGMLARVVGVHEARASLEKSAATLDRDVVVTARVASPDAALAVRTFRSAQGEAFFAAVVTPPPVVATDILPRDVTLVMDTSGSMEGEKMEQARASARWLLERMRPRDRVNVILFSDLPVRFAAEPVEASADNLAKLRGFVDAATANGSTALGDAIKAACDMPVVPGRVPFAVVLTDGMPTVGITAPEELCRFAKAGAERGLRVFTFGVGADVDSALLEGVAAAGRGTCEVFRAGGETETRLRAFVQRTETPVLANLRVEIDGRPADDLYPRAVSDVFGGEQAVLTGRMPPGATGDVHSFVVRAVLRGQEVQVAALADVPRTAGGSGAVRDLYARQKLAYLEQAMRLRTGLKDDAYYAALDRGAYSTQDEIVKAMIDLSLATGVQCPYTSFLVLLPEDRARLDPRDAEALEAAAKRARAKKAELAGVLPPRPDASTASLPPVTPEPPELIDRKGVPVLPGEQAGAVNPDENYVPNAAAGEITDATDPTNEAGVFNPEPEEIAGLPSGATGGTSMGVGSLGHHGTGVPSAFTARGGGGKAGGGGGLGQGGHGGRGGAAMSVVTAPAPDALQKRALPGGGWADDTAFPAPEGATFDPAVTGLVLLDFLGAGETHQAGPFKEQIKNALKALRAVQFIEGAFVTGARPGRERDHAIAAVAMTESFGMTQSKVWQDPAMRGLTYALTAILAEPAVPAPDALAVETAAWRVLLLYSGRTAGLARMTDAETRLLARLRKDPAHALDPDAEALRAAASALARILFSSDPDAARAEAAAEFTPLDALTGTDPAGAVAREPVTYFATLAAYHLGGDVWKRWDERVLKPRIDAQVVVAGSPEYGLWPAGTGGASVSRMRATALATLELEVRYRYPRVLAASATK